MKEVVIRESSSYGGEVSAPSSKAYTHRMLVAALLSDGVSKISSPLNSEDTLSTLDAIMGFGAEVKRRENIWEIKGITSPKETKSPIYCKESGTTARLMLPVAALASGRSTFLFGPSLCRRPIIPLLRSLRQMGARISFEQTKRDQIEIDGGELTGGKISMMGNVSSQFISGLLFACPKALKKTEITLTSPLESKGYVEMTLEVLGKHGVKIDRSSDLKQFRIPSRQTYNPSDHKVPGDFSSAAFLLAAAAITSSRVRINNLNYCSLQGDRAILDVLGEMGSEIVADNGYIEVEGRELNSIDIDTKDIPDLVPVCTVLACYCLGTSRLYNAKRLKYKESDRLSSIYTELSKMGARIVKSDDEMIIKGPCTMHGATINPHNDHRIAMACAIAALGAKGDTRIQHADCVEKSYPRFFEDLRLLGAEVVGK
ncbi:MAG: 3-phosphoshikimate 1-carboxyvinyltransferase [Candidatus Bathyarchaeota archaeon]|nr:3-phosphoshikimate 1-carboxyvinyltransferase [Candidatus Bathyarchaeota archaeon]